MFSQGSPVEEEEKSYYLHRFYPSFYPSASQTAPGNLPASYFLPGIINLKWRLLLKTGPRCVEILLTAAAGLRSKLYQAKQLLPIKYFSISKSAESQRRFSSLSFFFQRESESSLHLVLCNWIPAFFVLYEVHYHPSFPTDPFTVLEPQNPSID